MKCFQAIDALVMMTEFLGTSLLKLLLVPDLGHTWFRYGVPGDGDSR